MTQLPNILIQDGQAKASDLYSDMPDLETFSTSNSLTSVRLDNDVNIADLALRLPMVKAILVDFPAFTDGRGFSVARELRQKYNYAGHLIADGPLIPDQYVYAIQCGFDGVRIDHKTFTRHGANTWSSVLDDFDLTYQRGYTAKIGPEVSIFDARTTAVDAKKNSKDPYYGLSAKQALTRALDEYNGELVLASSLGVDSAVLLHLAADIDKSLPIVFLDTGKHFRETLAYRDQLMSRLGFTDFRNVTPDPDALDDQDQDGKLHLSDPDACCNLRKVQPLNKAIGGFKARVTGRKRYQTPDRINMPIFEQGGAQAKINPLAYWSAKDVTAYMRKHDLPAHPLLSLGFLSIGCQPCTTRVEDGEDPRAGRWRNSEKTECGIHYVDGKWEPTQTKKTYEVF